MPYTRAEIEEEYNAAAEAELEFEKVKWGSQEKMLNRMKLALELLPFSNRCRWLDVGCGTGAFQTIVCKRFAKIHAVAIDLSERLLDVSRSRPETRCVDFRLIDFLSLQAQPFQIITCIGVLQKTTMSIGAFFKRASEMMAPGGLLFVDTKHRDWEKFSEPDFFPDSDHEWFTAAELMDSASAAGLEIEQVAGFLPEQALKVRPEASHSIFIVARKP